MKSLIKKLVLASLCVATTTLPYTATLINTMTDGSVDVVIKLSMYKEEKRSIPAAKDSNTPAVVTVSYGSELCTAEVWTTVTSGPLKGVQVMMAPQLTPEGGTIFPFFGLRCADYKIMIEKITNTANNKVQLFVHDGGKTRGGYVYSNEQNISGTTGSTR